MSANSPQMTLEEKIVQKIKESALGSLVGDEDALTELTKRGIHEALFQPIRMQKQYGGWEDKDSPVVAAARKIADEAVKKIVEAEIVRLMRDVKVQKAVMDAMIAVVPNIIATRAYELINEASRDSAQRAMNALTDAMRLERNPKDYPVLVP